MSIRSMVESAGRIARAEGVEVALREGAYHFYNEAWRTYGRVSGRSDNGPPIWESDWDVLVILDACRVDLMKEAYTERDRDVSDVGTVWSRGSHSHEWMQANFAEDHADEMARTAYVTGNIHSDFECVPEEWSVLDEVWRYGWDETLGQTPPRAMTDRAIDTWRRRDEQTDRMIVHYMQPHSPFLSDAIEDAPPAYPAEAHVEEVGKPTNVNRSIWRRLRDGDANAENIWQAYKDTLHVALDEVEILTANIDADNVAISADHGNAIGEWGFYGHPIGVPIQPIREVPWITTTAMNTGSYDPDLKPHPSDLNQDDVTDRLEALGYT